MLLPGWDKTIVPGLKLSNYVLLFYMYHPVPFFLLFFFHLFFVVLFPLKFSCHCLPCRCVALLIFPIFVWLLSLTLPIVIGMRGKEKGLKKQAIKWQRKTKNPLMNQRSWRHIDLCHLGYATKNRLREFSFLFFFFLREKRVVGWAKWNELKSYIPLCLILCQ